MKGKASNNDDISLVELFERFPDDSTALEWFESCRWPDEVRCAHCDSDNVFEAEPPQMPYRCRDCKKHFSVKTNCFMYGSKSRKEGEYYEY